MSEHDPIRQALVDAAATARHRVRAHFMALHAVSPAEAIEYKPPGARELREFNKLRKSGLIRELAPGHYWFDLDRMAREPRKMSRVKVAVAVALCLVIASVLMLLYRG